MRKLVVVAVVLTGFGGLLLLGAFTALFGSMSSGGASWSECSSDLGPWADGSGRGRQEAGRLSQEQVALAQQIIDVGKQRQLPPKAWQIAIQAGKTESGLTNAFHGDRDSLGVFQMRPSMGWGDIGQITNVNYAINKFYDVLQGVHGWQQMRPGDVAQQVERSAYPTRYNEWEPMAAQLVSTQGHVPGISGCGNAPAPGIGVNKAISFAETQIGKPYIWGAAGPDSFDCSGLVQKAWEAAGVSIPKYTVTQYAQAGVKVPISQARPGDLIFWSVNRDPNAVHHVAIYIGNNEVIQAPQPGEGVKRSKMWDDGELMPMAVRPLPDPGTQAAPEAQASPPPAGPAVPAGPVVPGLPTNPAKMPPVPSVPGKNVPAPVLAPPAEARPRLPGQGGA